MRRNIVLFLTLALFVAATAFATAPVIQQRSTFSINPPSAGSNELDVAVWSEDFEGDVSDWTQTSPDVQADYWQTDDWFAANGTNAWRCFDYGFGDPATGGYSDDWLQFMITPALDFSAVTTASLEFNFSALLEGGNWDAANVWVFYGHSPGTLTKVIATPTSPAYTDTDAEAYSLWFGTLLPAYPCWAGESGMAFNNAFVAATFDLGAYVGYEYVYIVFGFASDTAYSSGNNTDMYGYIVDDIVVTADAATVWADDADGGNVGGPPTFETGAAAAGLPVLPFQVEIADCPTAYEPAPSPTMVAGVFADIDEGFDHYIEGPEFDLAALEPGESYWLECMWNSDIEDLNDFPNEFYWRPEIWNPTTNGWIAASTTANYVYTGGNDSTWEPNWQTDWDMSEYAGMDGVRLRIFFHAPDVARAMTHHLVDDLVVDLQSLQHDISTVLNMPYPTSVGTDVYGKVVLTNNAPNDETNFMAVWDLGGLVYPLYPGGPYNLNAGESLELSIDDPTVPGDVGFWIPTTVGPIVVDAYHTLGSDEIPENDAFPVSVDVLAADMYEVGTDSRSGNGFVAVYPLNTGPVVHINPPDVNGFYFAEGGSFDFSELRMDATFHSAAGGVPAGGCTMDFLVYAGGSVPGALVYTGTYTFPEAPGWTGNTQAILDVSAVPALQGVSGDFWVEGRITTPAGGGYNQPFPDQMVPNAYQSTQFRNHADAMAGIPLTTVGYHVTAVLSGIDNPNVTLTLTPTDPDQLDVPAEGGTIDFVVELRTYMGASYNNVDYWETAFLPVIPPPGYEWELPGQPESTFNVTPFFHHVINRTVTVPGTAPVGPYTFVGHMGFYPGFDYIQDTFTFTKAGVVADGTTEWRVDGESFGDIAGEEGAVASLPSEYALGQAYPNPFNPTTAISISLPEAADLKVTVFNVMGQQVAELANDTYNAGVHTLTFDGANMASGLYFIQAEVPGQLNELRKITLLK